MESRFDFNNTSDFFKCVRGIILLFLKLVHLHRIKSFKIIHKSNCPFFFFMLYFLKQIDLV